MDVLTSTISLAEQWHYRTTGGASVDVGTMTGKKKRVYKAKKVPVTGCRCGGQWEVVKQPDVQFFSERSCDWFYKGVTGMRVCSWCFRQEALLGWKEKWETIPKKSVIPLDRDPWVKRMRRDGGL